MRTTITCWAFTLALTCGIAAAQPAAPLPALTSSGPGSITIAPASITYFARGGDTLMSIASQFTGKPENWVPIGKLNRIDRDINIPIGTGILVPADLLNDDPTEAKVVALSGSITAKTADGAVTSLSIGTRVVEGTQIETSTNGFVTLSLPDESRISLPSNSRVKIAKLRMARYTKSPRTEITLMRGRIESRVSPLEATKGLFEIRTPQSVAGVRGTHFRVGILANGIANEVLSGKVAVTKTSTGDARLVAIAKGTIVDAQSAGSLVDLLPPPYLTQPAAADYPSAEFAMGPIAGAGGYHAQISTDSESLNIISENRAGVPLVKLDGVPDGNYFVRISAIDRSGLEGLTRTQPVRINARAAAIQKAASSAPYVDSSNARDIFLKWKPDAGKEFLLQVARDADFSWLMFSTRTTAPQARIPRFEFGTYYARVQNLGPDGAASSFSGVQPFIVTDQWVINDGNPVMANQHRLTPAR